jgi:hypothetical protein
MIQKTVYSKTVNNFKEWILGSLSTERIITQI